MKKKSLSHLFVGLGLLCALTFTQCGGGNEGGGGSGTQSGTGGQQVGVAPIVVPQVSIQGSANITVGTAVSYTATPQNISQPFKSIVWTMDGTSVAQGSLTAQVTAPAVKSYVLSVTITGADGQSATATANITAATAPVKNQLPIITIGNVPTGYQLGVNIPIQFTASDPDFDSLTYKIRLNNNITSTLTIGQHTPSTAASSGASIGQGGSLTHNINFASPGTYGPFVFIVEDTKGGSVQSTPFSITVTQNQIISAQVMPYGAAPTRTGETVYFQLNYTDPESDVPQNIRWEGDGFQSGTGSTFATFRPSSTSFRACASFSDLQGRSYLNTSSYRVCSPYYTLAKGCSTNPSHTIYAALAPTTSTGTWNGNYLYTVKILSGGGKSTSMSTSSTQPVLSLSLSGTDIGSGTSVSVTVTGGYLGQLALDNTRTYVDSYNYSNAPSLGSTSWTTYISAPTCQ